MDSFSITLTFTHLLIIWTLLSALFVWILLFAFLALRPEKEQPVEEPAHSFAVTQNQLTQPAMTLPQQAHIGEPVSEMVPMA